EYGSGTQRPAYLAYGTSSRRFFCYYAKLLLLISFGRVKDKLRFSGHSQKTICRYSAIAVYAFKGGCVKT
ncbi:hypothetical protein, partial [Cloacibacillus evryensis]|uniref:hypothetical protein n=1 Tax=Cloacibacillus evryensis TaxID=508460 RepID=UPI00210EDDA6